MKKDKDTCEKAILKLRNRFAVVGTTERLLESLAVMAYSFKFIDFPVFGRVNVQVGAPPAADVSERARKMIERGNDCDMLLFDVANSLLDEAITCLGDEFQAYLKKFKLEQSHFSRSNPFCIKYCVEFGKPHVAGSQIVGGKKTIIGNPVNETHSDVSKENH